MSLSVTADEINLAQAGTLTDEQFIEIIRNSLPEAFASVQQLADKINAGSDVEIDAPLHMHDSHRNQLLRMFASTSMREALERHFGIALAFQNCHYVGGASKKGQESTNWQRFTSKEGQVLAQRPELRDC